MLDQQSLDRFERDRVPWPWPRGMYAAALDFLTAAKARAVVFDILFTSQSSTDLVDQDVELGAAVARAAKAGVPVLFAAELSARAAAASAPPLDPRFALELPEWLLSLNVDKRSARGPIPELAHLAAAIGDVVTDPDPDGVYRRVHLISTVDGRIFPSLPLAVVQAVSGDRELAGDASLVRVAGRDVPLVEDRLLLRYHGAALSRRSGVGRTYEARPLADLILSWNSLQEKRKPVLPLEDFAGKIVFIGYSAPGLLDNRVSPVSPVFPGTEILAVAVDNLLHGDSMRAAGGAWVFALILLGAILGAASALGPRRFAVSLVLATCAAALLAGVAIAAFRRGVWIDLAAPELSLVFGFALASAYSYAVEGRQRRFIETAFSHYLSPHVVRAIVDDPEKLSLGGERRELTIFFSDIAGFTSFSEKLDPKTLTKLMNRYLGEMTDIILGLDGTVDKYIGDAIMAFWNAPLDAPDHAERACRAALLNQQRLKTLREEFAREGLPPVAVRIGLNTGPSSVGNMGSPRRFNYTAIGDPVNLASRLEGVNKYYGTYILLSGATEALARGTIETRELDRVKVKGKNEPIVLYELLGLKGETDPGLLSIRDEFAGGVEAYRRREWVKAEAAFRSVLERKADDGPSKLLLGRIQELRKAPPPDDWDGSHAMTEK